jgi:SCF-associated factor 1
LKLSDGTEMPGSKEFDEWKEGRPDWDLGNVS